MVRVIPSGFAWGCGGRLMLCVSPGAAGHKVVRPGGRPPCGFPFCVTSAEVVRVRVCGLGSARLLWCGWGLGERGSDLTGLGWTGKFGQVAPR